MDGCDCGDCIWVGCVFWLCDWFVFCDYVVGELFVVVFLLFVGG